MSTRSTHGRLKMAARKLNAIYKCVLAHGLCNAVTSTGCLRDHHSAGGRIPCYLSSSRLVSLMPRRLPLAASVILCRQPKYGASARRVCVRLPLGEGPALRNAEPPKSDGGILLDRVRSERAIGRGPRVSQRLRTWRCRHSYLNARGDVTTNTRKDIFQSSNAACEASISVVARSILYRSFNICLRVRLDLPSPWRPSCTSTSFGSASELCRW